MLILLVAILHVHLAVALNATEFPSAYTSLASAYGNGFVTAGNQCGGVVEGLAGGINFRLYEQIPNFVMHCVWTIVVPRRHSIKVQLVHDGFNDNCGNCQYVRVYGLRQGELVNQATMQPGNRNSYTITGSSLIHVVFSSQGDSEGFSFTFEGTGPDIPSNSTTDFYAPNFYDVFPTQLTGSPSGTINFPVNGTVVGNGKHLISFVVHANRISPVSLTLDSFSGYTGLSSCSYYVSVLRIYDVDRQIPSTNARLRHCGRLASPITTYSETPLFVSMFMSNYDGSFSNKFQLSWKGN